MLVIWFWGYCFQPYHTVNKTCAQNAAAYLENSVDSDQLASNEASWSGSTLLYTHNECTSEMKF